MNVCLVALAKALSLRLDGQLKLRIQNQSACHIPICVLGVIKSKAAFHCLTLIANGLARSPAVPSHLIKTIQSAVFKNVSTRLAKDHLKREGMSE